MARKELPVQPRQVTGKKVAQLRRAGVLPANIYGHGLSSVAVQVEADTLEHTLRAATANEVIDVTVTGERSPRPVVIQRIQRHPLNSSILHADFYQVSLREKMRAEVPLVFTGSSEAVGTYNGTLVTSLESLHVEALPLDLPAHIEIDLSPLTELESSIHVRDVSLASNLSVLNDPDVVIVKVASPSIQVELEEERVAAEAAAAEAAPAEQPPEAAAAAAEETAPEQ